MHAHITVHLEAVHFDHNHEGPLGRISRNVGAALDRLTGPALSEQDRLQQELADIRNRAYEGGML